MAARRPVFPDSADPAHSNRSLPSPTGRRAGDEGLLCPPIFEVFARKEFALERIFSRRLIWPIRRAGPHRPSPTGEGIKSSSTRLLLPASQTSFVILRHRAYSTFTIFVERLVRRAIWHLGLSQRLHLRDRATEYS